MVHSRAILIVGTGRVCRASSSSTSSSRSADLTVGPLESEILDIGLLARTVCSIGPRPRKGCGRKASSRSDSPAGRAASENHNQNLAKLIGRPCRRPRRCGSAPVRERDHTILSGVCHMSCETVEVLVVGGGQAGLAMGEHLSAAGVPHVVLERDRIVERWRTARWDSLVANGPAWHDRFPSLEFPDVGQDEFASKDQVVDYFVSYAERIDAPVRCGVEVTSVRRNEGRPDFHVETTEGSIDARYVVAATGPFQRPVIPPIVPADASPVQLHSSAYRNPDQLPDGAVLVVGAGSSGVQIADELLRS